MVKDYKGNEIYASLIEVFCLMLLEKMVILLMSRLGKSDIIKFRELQKEMPRKENAYVSNI